MTNQTYEMKEHAQLIKSIMKSHGFKVELTISGNIKVSLKYRDLNISEVSQVIFDEELPIDDSQLVASTTLLGSFGKTNVAQGVYSIRAVVIRL